MATINVTYRYRRIWLAKAWVRLMRLVSLVSAKRAERWALAGVDRIVQMEIISPRILASKPRSMRAIRSRP